VRLAVSRKRYTAGYLLLSQHLSVKLHPKHSFGIDKVFLLINAQRFGHNFCMRNRNFLFINYVLVIKFA